MSSDPQSWVFPPKGAALPPVAQTGSFGPVARNDRMVFEWSPASQQPRVYVYCLTADSNVTAVAAFEVCNGAQSPFTYTFTDRVDAIDDIFCHATFLGTTLGNSIVWQFQNTPAARARTWEGDNVVAASSSSGTQSSTSIVSSTLSSSSISSTTFSLSSPTSPTSPTLVSETSKPSSADKAAQSTGLSIGAKAGIGIGAAVLAVLFALTVLLFVRHRNHRRPEAAELGGRMQYRYEAPATQDIQGVSEWKPGPAELDTSRVQELHGTDLRRA